MFKSEKVLFEILDIAAVWHVMHHWAFPAFWPCFSVLWCWVGPSAQFTEGSPPLGNHWHSGNSQTFPLPDASNLNTTKFMNCTGCRCSEIIILSDWVPSLFPAAKGWAPILISLPRSRTGTASQLDYDFQHFLKTSSKLNRFSKPTLQLSSAHEGSFWCWRNLPEQTFYSKFWSFCLD